MLGRVAGWMESMMAHAWSAGEVAVAAARLDEVWSDPHRDALLDDIAQHGFYVPIDPADVAIRIDDRGRVTGNNPYRRVAPHPPERVMARLVTRGRRPSRRLVVVCHCYGIPVPALMERLFGLRDLDADVAYPIMGHHQRGSYVLWPGSGFSSARASRFAENMRAAVTGARALVAALMAARGYEHVSVVGFSIGGQLALHLANAERIDRAVLYCPVASIGTTASTLGLMRHFGEPLRHAYRLFRRDDPFTHLAITEALSYPMRTRARDVHVIVQKHDALTPVQHVEVIREAYPEVGWYVFEGTHLYPEGMGAFQRIIRRAIERD